MGIDTKILLPPAVQVQSVAEAIGILLGCPKRKQTLDGSHKPFYVVWVDAVKLVAIPDMPTCVHIVVSHESIKADYLYHFEGRDGQRLLMPRSKAENIALGRALIQLFGGKIDYADCDSVDVDLEYPPADWLCLENDKNFDIFNEALWQLEPLRKADIDLCKQLAAY